MKTPRRTIIMLTILLVNCAIGRALVSAGQSDSGSIGGRVIVEGGIPMEKVKVQLTGQWRDADGEVLERTINPDREGNFVFTGLPRRVYWVYAVAPGYISKRDIFSNRSVQIGETVTIELIRGGVITGRVTDQRGEPVVAINVDAIRVRDEAGNKISAASAGLGDVTDDRGVYRLFGLSGGAYVIGVNLNRVSTGPTAQDDDAPIYYPSSGRTNASEVSVPTGGEVGGIDISYRRDRAHTISGAVEIDEPGVAPFTVNLTILESSSKMRVNSISLRNVPPERQFTLPAIPDGDYILTTSGGRGMGESAIQLTSEPQFVRVRGGDVTGISIRLHRRSGLGGSIVVEPARSPEPPACQQLPSGKIDEVVVNASYLASDAERGLSNFYETTRAIDRNQFFMGNLIPGKYRLTFKLPGELWYLRAITGPASGSGAARIADLGLNFLQVKAGEMLGGITVTLAAGAASLNGRVDAINGRARIHLIPAEPQAADQLLRYAETTSDGEGRFQLRHLAPGRYYAVTISLGSQSTNTPQRPKAWDEGERAELRRLAENAKRVIDLQPCQRVNDYHLSSITVTK